MSGGDFGPNIFRHDRAHNPGRSEQGKLYRALDVQQRERLGRCTSATCSMPMTRLIPIGSRSLFC